MYYNRSSIVAIFQIAAQRPWIGLAFTTALTAFAMFCATKPYPAMNLLTKAVYISAIAVFSATLFGLAARIMRRIRIWIHQKRFLRAQRKRTQADYRQQQAVNKQRQAYADATSAKHYTYTQSSQTQHSQKPDPEPPPKKEPHPEAPPKQKIHQQPPPPKPRESPLAKHFNTLELKPGASMQDVKNAYYSLIKVWHPDRFYNHPRFYEKALEKTKQLNVAYHEIEKYYR